MIATILGVATVLFFGVKVFLDHRGAKPFPATGAAMWFTEARVGPRAGLVLEAPRGGKHFMVRLDDWHSGAPIVTIPVRDGETAEVRLPLGRYKMTIAKGTTWLGPSGLFGALGEVREVTQPIEFYQQGPTLTGQRFRLEVPFRGNVDTVPVRKF